MGTHMLGVQPPSFEMSPFPELLGPPPHFCRANVRRQQVRSVGAHISCDRNAAEGRVILEKGSHKNLEGAHHACVGPWALWYHSLPEDYFCAPILHTPVLPLAHIFHGRASTHEKNCRWVYTSIYTRYTV